MGFGLMFIPLERNNHWDAWRVVENPRGKPAGGGRSERGDGADVAFSTLKHSVSGRFSKDNP